jgi:hypothetical protein
LLKENVVIDSKEVVTGQDNSRKSPGVSEQNTLSQGFISPDSPLKADNTVVREKKEVQPYQYA